MFLLNLNGFNSFPLSSGSKVCTKERSFQGVEGKRLKVIQSIFPLSPFMFCITYLFFFLVLSQFSFMLCVFSFMFLFWLFSVCFTLFFIKKKMKNTKTVCLYILVLVYRGWPLKQNFLNFISLIA